MASDTKLHCKKGDMVAIIAGKGKHLDQKGRVLSCDPRSRRVIVEGCNIVKKHQRPQGRKPGGIMEKPAPIHVSNVMVICTECKVPGRMKRVRNADGGPGRVCRHCGANIDQK